MKSEESGDNLDNLLELESITETGDEEEDEKAVMVRKKQKKNDERQDKNLKIAQSAFQISHSLNTAENHVSNAFNEMNMMYQQLVKAKKKEVKIKLALEMCQDDIKVLQKELNMAEAKVSKIQRGCESLMCEINKEEELWMRYDFIEPPSP